MKTLFTTFFSILTFVLVDQMQAQTSPPECTFTGGLPAKFEPRQGNSYFIIGQNNSAISGYMSNVGSTPMPSGFTLYTNPRNEGLFNSFYNNNCETNNILGLANDPTYDNSALVIGYFWADSYYGAHIGDVIGGNPNQAFINDLDAFADWCKAQNRPIFLRLGFEFDLQYVGYHDFYVATWQFIVNRFRNVKNVDNVAFVWQASYGDGNWANDYAQFYPGDSYVDWFGYSQWETGRYGHTMVQEARNHGKPLMICEAAPKTQSGQWSWYNDVFNYIKANDDVIKGFAYINFDWISGPPNGCWPAGQGWGDSEIQDHPTIETNWLTEMANDFWLKGGSSSFYLDAQTNWNCAIPAVKCDFSVENDIDRIYQDESLDFIQESYGSETITGYSWNFGTSGGTSSSSDPTGVSWSSPGLKTVTLAASSASNSDVCTTDILVEPTPDGCAFSDEFDNSTVSEQFIDRAFGCCAGPGVNNAFGHDVSNNVWTASVNGHGSFDFFTYHFNDDANPFSINLSHLLAQPIVTIRARKVPNTTNPVSGSTDAAMVKIDMFDFMDITTDALPSGSWDNRIVLTEQFQDYTIDFTGFLENHFGLDGLNGLGPLDDRKMLGLRMMVNPFWNESYAYAGFDQAYSGDIEIENIHIGVGCDGAPTPCITADKGSAGIGEDIKFSSCSGGNITSYSWNFGSGASPATANTEGPHTVSYSTTGVKTITLTLNASVVGTTTVNISNCDAAYIDHFTSSASSQFTGGGGSSPAFSWSYDAGEDALAMSSSGHGEWDYATIKINDGITASPVQISESNPTLFLRVKATTTMSLRVSPVGANGALAQTNDLADSDPGYEGTGKFDLPVTTQWQTYEIDFSGELWDEWSGTGSIHDGAGNNSPIEYLRIMPNQGWASCTGCASLGANSAFVGTLYFDYILMDGDTSQCLGSGPTCPGITTANAGPDQSICAGESANLAANQVAAGETGTWTGASVSNSSSPTATASGLSSGVHILTWTITDNTGLCPPSSDQVSITVDDPVTANAGTDQSVSVDNTTMSASGSGSWTVVTGTGSFSNANSSNSAVSGLSTGTNTFRWTVSSGNSCPDAFDDVNITYTQSCQGITTANAGPNQSVCQGTTINLSANLVATGETGTWSGATISNINDPNATVLNLAPGTTILTWTITDDAGLCTPSSDQVSITIDTPPVADAGSDQSIGVSSTTLNAVGSGTWSVLSGSASISNVNDPLSSVSNLSEGSNRFIWTVSSGNSCSDDMDTVNIIYTPGCPGITPADAGLDESLCDQNSYQLSGNTPGAGESGTWTGGSFSNSNDPNATVSGLTNGSNILTWTITDNAGLCPPSSSTVTITIHESEQANAGPDQTMITDNTTLSGNAPTIGIGSWSVVSGTGVFANTGDPNTSVTGISMGTNVFRWTISNASCTDQFDEVTVTRDPNCNLTQPNAGSDQTVCSTTGTLGGNNPTVGTGTWSVVAGSSTLDNPTSANTGISNLSNGINTFRWTIAETGCPELTDDVTITVSCTGGHQVDFSADKTNVCPGNSVTFINTTVGAGPSATYTWDFGNGSTASGIGPHTITYPNSGSYTVSLTVTDGTSVTETKTNYIEVSSPNPGPISGDQLLPCDASNVTYSVPNTPGSIYNWAIPFGSITSGQGTSQITVDFTGETGSGIIFVGEFKGGCVASAPGHSVELCVNGVNSFEKDLVAYPNPFDHVINVEGIPSHAMISIIDLKGIVLIQQELGDDSRINTDDLPNGVYLLKIEIEDGVLIKRMIKTN